MANAAYFLHQYIDSRETNLHYATRVIIQDFGFREAVATNNVPTITSMLTNHAGRIQADLMLVLNDNGELIAANELDFPLSDLADINWLAVHGISQQGQFVEINNRLYRLFSVPINAPHQVAISIIAFEINAPLLEELKLKTGLDIVFESTQTDLFLTTLPIHKAEFDHLLQTTNEPDLWWQRSQFLLEEVKLKNVNKQPIQLFLLADLSIFSSGF